MKEEPARPESSVPGDTELSLSTWLRLARVYQLILSRLRRKLREQSGCTLPQFDVLAQLHRFGRGMTFVELSRELLVTSGNLTGIVDRLSKMGYVKRRPDERDRRLIRVVLTPAGTSLMERLLPLHAADVHRLLQGLAGGDLHQLRRILGRLRSSLHQDET